MRDRIDTLFMEVDEVSQEINHPKVLYLGIINQHSYRFEKLMIRKDQNNTLKSKSFKFFFFCFIC